MDDVEHLDGVLSLVRLQLTDQMQLYVGIGVAKRGPFCLSLLYAVFAKDPVTRLKQRLDPLGRMRFADRDKGDILGFAPRRFAHARDIGFHFGETGCCTFHKPRYRASVERLKPLPALWLISDQRNDAGLEGTLRRLPRGSGFIYRHYHLGDPERWQRFRDLRRVAIACGHLVILSDSALTATEWGADGIYGPARSLYPRRRELLSLATAHDLGEIGLANRLGADAVLLSPVFPTRSHPGSKVLGPAKFRLLARHSKVPVIALGGMDAGKVRSLQWPRWAAIDGLSQSHIA